MLQNAKATAFNIFTSLREKQQGVKLYPPRLGSKNKIASKINIAEVWFVFLTNKPNTQRTKEKLFSARNKKKIIKLKKILSRSEGGLISVSSP